MAAACFWCWRIYWLSIASDWCKQVGKSTVFWNELYLTFKPVLSLAIKGDILLTRLVCISVCLRKVCRVESQRYTTEVWGLLMTSPRLLANTSRVNEWICRKLASVAPSVSILWCSENFWLLPSLYTIELEKNYKIFSHIHLHCTRLCLKTHFQSTCISI